MFLNHPEALIIEKTENTPEIIFDIPSQKLAITGESRPEDPDLFYAPAIQWIKDLAIMWQDQPTHPLSSVTFILQFKLYYFNSTSSKPITDIILSAKTLVQQNFPLSIEWHYDKEDLDMLESGKEFSETFDVAFKFVES